MNQKTLRIICLLGLILGDLRASEPVVFYALKQGLAQGALMLKAQAVSSLIKNPHTPEKLRKSLELSQEVLAFADQIPMKRGASYKKYVDLDRDWVSQAITVAYKNKLEIKKFSFPIVGELPYKGFFSEEEAIQEEKVYSANYDVFRRKVPAFSGLGWFSDLLTSNLIGDDFYLVETLFHELVHLNFYFENESDFNEAFATWFSYKALEDFLSKSKKIEKAAELLIRIKQSRLYDEELALFVSEIIRRGNNFYAQKQNENRSKYFNWVRNCLKEYSSLAGLERIEWNNAAILSFSTYTRLIPFIEAHAKKHHLSYGEFLKQVMSKGPDIVKDIGSSEPLKEGQRCDQIPI